MAENHLLIHHLVIADKAVFKEASVVKSIALHKKSARVARIAQGHKHLEKDDTLTIWYKWCQ